MTVLLGVGPLVGESDLEALVEERHLLQPLEQRLRAELGLVEDRRVGPERDGRAALLRRADLLQRTLRRAALRVRLHPLRAVAVHLELELHRERVDDRHADAVQAAGDLVAVAAELPARVQRGEDDLGGGLAPGVRVDRDAAPVVGDATAAVGEDRDVDARGLAGHRLVDRVVDDLVHEVVQARRTRRADVHARALTDGLQPLEDGDVLRRVAALARAGALGRGRPLGRRLRCRASRRCLLGSGLLLRRARLRRAQRARTSGGLVPVPGR